jgi:hypothetical protein
VAARVKVRRELIDTVADECDDRDLRSSRSSKRKERRRLHFDRKDTLVGPRP